MEVVFRTRELRRCYQDSREASRKWGQAVGAKYVERITVLQATPVFDDLYSHSALRLHLLKGNRQGDYAVTVHGRWRLIVTLGAAPGQLIVKEMSDHYDD